MPSFLQSSDFSQKSYGLSRQVLTAPRQSMNLCPVVLFSMLRLPRLSLRIFAYSHHDLFCSSDVFSLATSRRYPAHSRILSGLCPPRSPKLGFELVDFCNGCAHSPGLGIALESDTHCFPQR